MQRIGKLSAADVLTATFGKEKKFAHIYRQSSNSFVWNSAVFHKLPSFSLLSLTVKQFVIVFTINNLVKKKGDNFLKSRPVKDFFGLAASVGEGVDCFVFGRFMDFWAFGPNRQHYIVYYNFYDTHKNCFFEAFFWTIPVYSWFYAIDNVFSEISPQYRFFIWLLRLV